MATNATIFVFIESDGVIVIFSAGQHRDPAWQSNPLMKRSMLAYLAANETVHELFNAQLDFRDAERLRFVRDVVMEGIAPSNYPLISPLGWKALVDTGGLSVIRGLRHFVGDMASAPRVPSMVEPDAFTRAHRAQWFIAARCSN